MAKEKDGCVKPAAGPIMSAPAAAGEPARAQEVRMTMARVGKEAPDFEANAYVAGQGFKTIKLSSYRGRWVVVCFYPGDFTFV
jgi:hypothetical protein